MSGLNIVKGLDEELDVLGQLPDFRLYSQLCLCFPVLYASSHATIIYKLTNGLERLSASFPWIAGQVINEGAGEDNTGVSKIKPLEKIPRLTVKDLRGDSSIPTMDDLRQAHFPFSMLDESRIAPRRFIPGSSDEPKPDASPVFLVQANFITGGLLLTFVAHHSAMDMTGQGQVIYLLSKACRGEPFTVEELASGNLARHGLIPMLDDSYPPPELVRQMVNPTPSGALELNDRQKTSWTYFTFSASALASLKSLAAKWLTHSPGSGAGYISTDDALSAFIWQSVTRSRLPRFNRNSNSPSANTFARVVNTRRYLPIPATYPGVILNVTYQTYPLERLVSSPLGTIASLLRSAVDPQTSELGQHTRALATFLASLPDKRRFSFAATLDHSADLIFTSWTKVNCYELEFGFGNVGGMETGRPEAVRRPRSSPIESLVHSMPRRLDGEVAVALCLRDEDLERLRADEEFGKYAKYVG